MGVGAHEAQDHPARGSVRKGTPGVPALRALGPAGGSTDAAAPQGISSKFLLLGGCCGAAGEAPGPPELGWAGGTVRPRAGVEVQTTPSSSTFACDTRDCRVPNPAVPAGAPRPHLPTFSSSSLVGEGCFSTPPNPCGPLTENALDLGSELQGRPGATPLLLGAAGQALDRASRSSHPRSRPIPTCPLPAPCPVPVSPPCCLPCPYMSPCPRPVPTCPVPAFHPVPSAPTFPHMSPPPHPHLCPPRPGQAPVSSRKPLSSPIPKQDTVFSASHRQAGSGAQLPLRGPQESPACRARWCPSPPPAPGPHTAPDKLL